MFLNWLIISGIIIVLALIVLRLIHNAIDMNYFSWPSRTIRRLTDPMFNPMRRGLVSFGVDSKYAPVVTILVAILLGWFMLQLLSSVANTLVGIILAAGAGALVQVIGYFLYGLLGIYSLLIFIRIIFSWGTVGYQNRVMRFLVIATDPLLVPLRRIVPPLGMFDISPIVGFIIIWLFQSAIAGTLLRGQPLMFIG